MKWLRQIFGGQLDGTGGVCSRSAAKCDLVHRLRTDIDKRRVAEDEHSRLQEESQRILDLLKPKIREYTNEVNTRVGQNVFQFFEEDSVFGVKSRGSVKFFVHGATHQICAEFMPSQQYRSENGIGHFSHYGLYVVDPEAVTREAFERYLDCIHYFWGQITDGFQSSNWDWRSAGGLVQRLE